MKKSDGEMLDKLQTQLDKLDEETREAMADFQERYGLEVTGEPNKETEEKLIQLHDEFGGIVPGTNSP